MDDEKLMRAALAEAVRAAARGEVPVGAVIAREGRIIARGSNRPIGSADPTAHAEIVAIRKACKKAGNYRLPDCDLYVSVEPCAMCLGAVVQARLRRLVFGAADPKAGAVSSVMELPFDRLNHHPVILGGVLAGESAALLGAFFRARRNKQGFRL